MAVTQSVGWEELAQLASTAASLTAAIDADPIDHLRGGYHRFRRYAPRMLDALELRGGRSTEPLIGAVAVLRDLNRRGRTELPADVPVAFASSKWKRRLVPSGTSGSSPAGPDRRQWETAVLFALRNALRSGGRLARALASARRARTLTRARRGSRVARSRRHHPAPCRAPERCRLDRVPTVRARSRDRGRRTGRRTGNARRHDRGRTPARRSPGRGPARRGRRPDARSLRRAAPG